MWSKCCWGFLGFAHLLLHSRSSCCVFYGVLFPEVRGSLEEQAGGSVNQGLLFAVLCHGAGNAQVLLPACKRAAQPGS